MSRARLTSGQSGPLLFLTARPPVVLQKTEQGVWVLFVSRVLVSGDEPAHTHRSTEYQNGIQQASCASPLPSCTRKPSPERSKALLKVMHKCQFVPRGSSFGETTGEIVGVNLRGLLQHPRLKPQMKSRNQNAGSWRDLPDPSGRWRGEG